MKWAWKKQRERLSDQLVEGTLKFGGGNLMMTWKGIGYAIKIKGKMDAQLYVNILEDELAKSLEWWGVEEEEDIFQQDNDLKHTSKLP